MIALTFDTSAHLCAAALYDGTEDRIIAETSQDIGRGHAERLFVMLGELLAAARITYGDIGRICCAAGPGSFTGVRVGLASAKGLGLGLRVPVFGLNNLEALKEFAAESGQPPDRGPVLVAVNARRDAAYCQYFAEPDRELPAGAFLFEHGGGRLPGSPFSREVALCGSAAVRLAGEHGLDGPLLHELATAPVGTLARLAAKNRDSLLPPEPIYLRAADAKPQSGFAVARQ